MTICECCGNDEARHALCVDCMADPCTHGAEPREDVFLVAFGVTGAKSRDDAQDVLIAALKHRLQLGPRPFGPEAYVEEWWVAEHDRRDHSDNDSAEFVPYRRPAADTTKAVAP